MKDRVVRAVFAAAVVAGCGSAFGEVLHWRGTLNEIATNPMNWVNDEGLPSRAPEEGDAIVLDAGANPMTWDVNEPVSSWTQTADYTGTVTFQTGISRKANGADKVAYGALAADGVTRVLKVTGNVTVNGGTWTHEANPTMKSTEDAWIDGKGVWRLIADIGGNFTLGEGGTVDVSEKGFPKGCGPGGNSNTSPSYGGIGVRISYGYSGGDGGNELNCYGSIKWPDALGSGGTTGQYGGGAAVFKVGGKTTLAGSIRANGTGTSGSASGTGGSVVIRTGELEQTGEISADGGYSSNYGPGSGGRIALIVTGANATLAAVDLSRVHAFSGTRKGSWAYAGHGTVYLETPADAGRGELWLNAGGLKPQYGYGAQITDWAGADDTDFSRVSLTNGGAVCVIPGGVLKTDAFNATLDDSTTALYMQGGTVEYTGNVFTNAGLSVYGCIKLPSVAYSIANAGVIRVAAGKGVFQPVKDGGAAFVVDRPLTIDGDVLLTNGVTVASSTYSDIRSGLTKMTATNHFDLVVSGDMTVCEDCAVDVTERGYTSGTGPGCPLTAGWQGGAYGGQAGGTSGVMAIEPANRPKCYGSIREPHDLGSGGSGYTGGGAIKLTVGGTLTLDGKLYARGKQATTGANSAPGGSVWVIAGRLVSHDAKGKIDASGGPFAPQLYNGQYHYAASGGGRIAVTLTEPDADFTPFGDIAGRIIAYGSYMNLTHEGVKQNTPYGAAGTVYLRTGAQAIDQGTLIVSNGGSKIHPTETAIEGTMPDEPVGNVLVDDGAVFLVSAGRTLTVNGSLTTTAGSTFTNDTGATVVFAGAGKATISGTNGFCNLTCEVPGKTLEFATEGSLPTVRKGGTLLLAGEEGNPIRLCSATPGTQWPLCVEPGAETSVDYVDVTDSDASSGALIPARNSTGKEQNNKNWSFVNIVVGAEIVWTGANGGDWADAGNWDLGRAPVATDKVFVNAIDGGTYPRLSAEFTGGEVTVAAGATLTVDGCLTVTKSLKVSGTLAGSGTVTLTGADTTVDLASATFDFAAGTFAVDGLNEAALPFGDSPIGKVVLAPDGGTVSFPAGVRAKAFSAKGSGTLVFGSGKIVRVDDLRVDGLVGGVASLALSASGTEPWLLDVKRVAQVNGVTVGGSDASAGLAVYATGSAPDVAAPNVRWFFTGSRCAWTGEAGTGDFGTAENWSSGKVPGPDDTVVVDGAAAVTANEAIDVRDVFVLSGTLTLKSGGAVANGIEVAGGKLVLDAPTTVGNSVYLREGTVLTHDGNDSEELYKLDLTVGGEMVLEDGALIDVIGKGYAAKKGPGAATKGGGIGGTYGGIGSDANSHDQVPNCYGSIRRPVSLGSGGASSSGGGAVKLTVAGVFACDGDIMAEGQPDVDQYSGSGGSIYITAADLVGTGWIDADGGHYKGNGWAAGGGRIAIWLTEATDRGAFAGKVSAFGSLRRSAAGALGSTPHTSPGTVFWHVKGDEPDGGYVLIDGLGASRNTTSGYPSLDLRTELPPAGVGGDGKDEFKNTTFEVVRGGTLTLADDVKIHDLVLGDGGRLRLDGHTLHIESRTHRNGKGWTGTTVVSSVDEDDPNGQIVWAKWGLMLFVR